ncbi:methyltransferase domain-containing protein [Patescibacteria group bacterium]|nr:methyltransferase domain-containing protein [Candidatus Falkowbacteria bacterium]MBU3906159.1 methyltransferase domain-containing protein [Patescibacteria group bacterium]MCG2697511.1 methyltransferase domain-containing protein [Candidatus Parcubacteria bacterium]MBU4014979.1 methyltransferase domain-containing protein [Patescibacteria group bacterium]MBU4026652.1 methyltransferase domain-containing protein [Patescibacteria group bacterium]
MLKTLIKTIVQLLGYSINKINKPIVKQDYDKDYFIKKLSENYKKNNIVKLHFGCGPRILKTWINIDLTYCHYKKYLKSYTNKYYPKNIRGSKDDFYEIDITKTSLPLPNNSVDVIFHEDFMEHLSQKGQVLFLSETLRVLKSGSIHRVNTPNLLTSMDNDSDFTKGFNGVFIHEWDKHRHINILTPKILEEMALTVGYSKVIFTTRDNSTSKYIPLEYRPDPISRSDNGNIFADLVK